jgi:hypothetical protein
VAGNESYQVRLFDKRLIDVCSGCYKAFLPVEVAEYHIKAMKAVPGDDHRNIKYWLSTNDSRYWPVVKDGKTPTLLGQELSK